MEAQSEGVDREAGEQDRLLRGFVGYSLRRASVAVIDDFRRVLAPFDLRRMTFSALATITDRPGVTQSQLGQALMVERPNMVAVIAELEDRGLILRERIPEDRRAWALVPTQDGRSLIDTALAAVAAHEARILAEIPADGAHLTALLRLIEDAARRGTS